MAVPNITSNWKGTVPEAGWITWDAFTCRYMGVAYGIPSGYTDQRFTWWRYNNGDPVMEAGPSIPADLKSGEDLVLFGNKDGIAIRIQSTTLVDGDLIVDGTVLAKHLAADAIDGKVVRGVEVEAGTFRSGNIEVGLGTWDPERGIRIPQAGGGMISLPVDGETPASITAKLTARSLDVEDDANFYGGSALFGSFQIADGIGNPRVKPDVSSVWPSSTYTELGDDDVVGPHLVRGMCPTVGNNTEWTVLRTFWQSGDIRRINKTTGEINPFIFPEIAPGEAGGVYGIGVIGSHYYVLAWVGNAYRILKLNSSYQEVDRWKFEDSLNQQPVMTTDGTYIYVSWVTSAGNLVVRQVDPVTKAQVTQTNLGSAPGSHALRAIVAGNMDYGSQRFVIVDWKNDAYVYKNGQIDNGETFTSAGNKNLQAMAWDAVGSKFQSLDNRGYLRNYSSNRVGGYVNVAFSWYDSVGTTHESMCGPATSIFWSARTNLAIETPPAPQVETTGNDDAANQVRVYAGSSSLILQSTLGVGYRNLELSSLATTGSTPKLENQFDSLDITPGRIESVGVVPGTANKLIQLEGDGSGRAGPLLWNSMGRLTDVSPLLTPSGGFTGGLRFWRLGQLVFYEGYVQNTGNIGTGRVSTGIIMPAGFQPLSETISSPSPGYNTSFQYRYIFNTNGSVEIQRTGTITTYMTVSGYFFRD